ncbi:DUF1801 domain-containing protein [Leucobacter coleopterorum]|uniref:DUF1801 domain-containing protein n=1 Tax=Leucobacter coleopterorum TaxID=2714933 RepID=A0ABX6JZS3_9MICO|nr:DUF1801 domain-containing protein [Leucobacter coleopterorum]QIM19728.1 DUF1801 domain-containing protein [Leucobacter coleopterorum]
MKWQAPTFVYRGNIASFYPKTKTHVSLMFHHGAAMTDAHNLLEGTGRVSRVIRFQNEADLENKRQSLQELIVSWIADHDD